jgi:hypothetical protein
MDNRKRYLYNKENDKVDYTSYNSAIKRMKKEDTSARGVGGEREGDREGRGERGGSYGE